mmetsp:Transcript_15892/g.23378  ORF Transcript_15892/g.23378 Transcript_15892/m.23378 type:complete len:264 (-) Transcript_15892:35-826(-)|eukprot:CAMPEP_0194215988 /NCGR_PEP_ID=MMETSP0156-20130528/18189_1 /TAXON_ID=33649 /ORGANISM="Thalassionema nitzschioides, Strain L26-B" /LENGTH=263 /DNA_ID=CAMNT_0038944653 /DNA_START=87 /DNA_END=878 /DNA_ORIENTATION=+
MTRLVLRGCLTLANLFLSCHAFLGALTRNRNLVGTFSTTSLEASKANASRRSLLGTMATVPFLIPQSASADFAPGGTLVEYEVGVQVGNEEASLSRQPKNSNVLFKQDYYFKFGTAAKFIPPGSTDFPKTMPFVLSQQRYDNLKKYGDRVKKGVRVINGLIDVPEGEIADPSTADVYQLRPMGLLANGFLASENTGTTNELLLARYYINEIYLDIGDMMNAPSQAARKKSWIAAKKAVNSYYGMLNRSINAKVGDQFELLSVE